MRTLIFLFLFFAWLVYYGLTAVYTGFRNLDETTLRIVMATHTLLVVAAVASPFFYRRWSERGWPHPVVKYTIHTLIALFIGLLAMAAVVFIGDLVVGLKAIVLGIFAAFTSSSFSAASTITRSPLMAQLAIATGTLLFLGLLYGVTRRYRYQVRRVQVPVDNLPPAFQGLRIVQLSDIHSGSFDNPKAVRKGVATAVALQPDLILFSGDLVNNRADEFEPYLPIFAQLRAPLGVYSVLGNHDYGDYIPWPSTEAKQENLRRLIRYQQQAGWKLLLNESVTLHKGNDALTLLGVENWSGRAGFSRYGDLARALEGTPTDQPAILISHDPSHWLAEVADVHPQIALTLSGHTHGMQFGIESRWFRWSPVQYMYKQWAGLYQHGRQYLYVNRGFGFLGYLGRLGMPPEITLLELVQA